MHSLSVVQQWLVVVARPPRLEWASSCCSYTVPAVRNIDYNIEQAARTVPAFADIPVDTNNPFVGHIRTHTVLLLLLPVAK